MALSYLESRGIQATLGDEELVSTAWHLGRAVGGIKLLVPRAQADEASAILSGRRGHSPEAGSAPESTDVRVERASRIAAGGLIFPPLQFYSLVLLGGLIAQWGSMPNKARRQYAWAWILHVWLLAFLIIISQGIPW